MIHFVITIVSAVSLDDSYTQEKLDYGYSKFGGRRRGWGRCIAVDVKTVNCFELQIIPSRSFASLAHASKQPIKKQEIIATMHSVVSKIQI